MKPRGLRIERLEDRYTMDTASTLLWESTPLSATNDTATLSPAPASIILSMDLALPDGSRIARGLLNGTTEVFDTATGHLLQRIDGNGSYVSQIAASPDGRFLLVGTGKPNVRVFDASTYAEVGSFDVQGFVYSIEFIGDEAYVSTWDNLPITVYNLATGATRTIAGGERQAHFLTTIGERLYAYDYRGTLKELDRHTGATLRSVAITGGSMPDSSKTSELLAIGTADGTILFFDADLHQRGAFQTGIGHISHVGFDAMGLHLTARGTNSIVFLDASAVPGSGPVTEAGRTTIGDAGRYEAGVPMSPDGTVAFLKTEGSILAQRTPWEAAVDHIVTETTENIADTFALPSAFRDLIGDAVALSVNSNWRAPETSEMSVAALRRGAHVNLRTTDGLAVGVHATVAANGAAVTARVYRGTDLVTTLAVPTNGTFHYENENGMTDVLFTTNVITPMTVANVTIETDEDQAAPLADPIGNFTSAPYGIANAPVVPLPTSIPYVARKLRFTETTTIIGESRLYIVRDPTQFTLIRSMVSTGSGRISMVGTIKKDGVDYMGREYGSTSGFPEGYARWIGENAVLIAPGAPAPISFIVGAYGSRGSIVVSHGASMDALMPPSAMSAATVDVSRMTMNDQHQTEGIFLPLTEVRESPSPTFSRPGDIANLQYHVRNEALNGGKLTVRVYVGWHAGEPTRGTLQNTFNLAMAGGQTQRISVNVTAPGKPADATSERPIISVVTTFPNGTTAMNTMLGKEPESHEKRVYTHNDNGTMTMRIESTEYTRREQDRIHRLTDRALNALLSSNDHRLVAVRDTLGTDHVIDLIARNTAAALAAADQDANTAAIDQIMAELEDGVEEGADDLLHDREGVGGSDDAPPNTQKLLSRGINGESPSAAIEAAGIIGLRTPSSIYNEVLSWSVPVGHALSDDFAGFDSSTIAGRMLTAGIMQMHLNRGDERAQWETAFMLQAVTDIPAEMLINVANAGLDSAVMRRFKAMLETAQYNHLTSPTAAPTTPIIVMAAVNKPKYLAGDESIRIRFDVGGTTSGVRSVQVFENGAPLSGARSIGFITVPIVNMPSRVPPTTGPLPETVQCDFTIKIVLEDGTVMERSVNDFEIDIHLPDALRDPPNGNESGNEHISDVTALIRDHFPLGNAANYYMYLGSSYHDGNEFYAADLNSLGGTDTDRGHVMKAIASGAIRFGTSGSYTGNEEGDLRIGVIVIDHGEGLQSGYMHMPIFKGAMKPHPTTGAMVQHYEVRQQEPIYTMLNGAQKITGMRFTGNIIEFYDGMPIEQDSPTGYVGGRNGGSEDAGYYEGLNNAHSHFFVKKNGASVNLWPGLSAAGMTVVKAYDTGPDGIPDTPWPESDEYTISVRFDTTLNAWVNDTLKLVVNRSNQEPQSPGVQTGQYFMAWEGNNVAQMKKVVYKQVGEMTDTSGMTIPIFRWVKHDAIDYNNSIWDPLSQSWTSFSL